MLLELYDKSHKKLANLTGTKSPHIQRTLEYGDETLDFYYPASGPWLGQITAECYVRTDRQEYVVKAVEKSTASAWRKISCALNIEELEGTPFQDFETVEQTVKAAAEFALAGTGWTVEADADITKKRTIRKEDDTTAWEVAKQIVDTYRVELEIDAVNKRLLFHTRRGRDRGAYFIERLNLRSLGVKTSSYGFYTRLIPIGKDGLHLWRDGQNYIENHQYSDKVITSIWRDERYTVTAALLEDATARLAEASAPACAYTAELVDLAAQSDKYNALAYDLGDAVLLVSEKTDEREKQRIVKLDEYPDDPLANKAELSNVKQTFAQLQKTEAEMATADAVAIATKRTKKVLRDDYLTKEETKVAISAMAESIELEVSKKYLTVASGEAAINKALKDGKEYTDGKLTEYSTTEETKGLISQSAEQITLEVSKTYATKTSVEESVATLQAAAKSAQETADKANNDAAAAQAAADKAATDAAAAAAEADKAKQAAADAEANAAADAQEKANAAQAAAEKAAAADAQAKAAAAEAAAKQAAAADAKKKADAAKKEAQDYTDGKLTDYSTTEETKSLISQSAKQITLEVSKTYATQGQLDDYTKTSEVRSRFAMDASSVTIDAGRLTFNSNTIVINSTNFKLDASGNVTAAGTFKSVSDKWEATLRSGGLFMNYDGKRRVELFKASNSDGGYLRLNGTYDGEDTTATYAPKYISMESVSKGKSLIMMPEYINLTENSKTRFAITQGTNDGVPSSNSAVVQSPDGDVMARLMCGNVQGAPQAKLEFLHKVDNILWTVMNLTYDGSKNRVTLYAGKNAELYIQGKKF